MNKYQQIEFGKLSEAIAFIEDGGVIYQLDAGHGYDLTIKTLAKNWPMRGLFTDAPKPKWYEKLDGTVDNGVLCWCHDYGEKLIFIDLICTFKEGVYKSSREECCGWLEAAPLTRTEIQRFMDNSPE